MDLGKNATIRLRPEDEYMHPIEAASNFNESMYINLFDHQQQCGGWFRVGNRPNEGHAEMSFCFYLPDGQVAFMFQRANISGNEALDAGGMRFEIIEPFKTLKVTYSGPVVLLKNPQDMDDPKVAFTNNPKVEANAEIVFHGMTPVYGGEAVDDQGNPIEEDPSEAFARAHYEQHMTGQGTVNVGDQTFELNGLGLRDHSWGLATGRTCTGIAGCRWYSARNWRLTFPLSNWPAAANTSGAWCTTPETVAPQYDLIESAELSSELDDRHHGQKASITTVSGAYRQRHCSVHDSLA